MNIGRKMTTRRIVLIGLFAALCFVGTWLHIPITLGGSNSMIHLGTATIFIAAVLIGKDAGLAAAIGCALFDASNPAFMAWVIPTFIIKGLTGYAAGYIAFARGKQGMSMVQNIIGFVAGGVVSLLGYFIVNWLVFVGFETALLKMITSITTTGIGVAIAVVASGALQPMVRQMNRKSGRADYYLDK